jgi:transposase
VLKPPTQGIPVLVERMLLCRALVGLADIDVVGVIGWTVPMQVHIASTLPRPSCSSCGMREQIKQTMRRRLVDLPSFGRPGVTVWRQIRWRCPDPACVVGSWMQTDARIVIGHRGITDRAARRACEQVGRHGRSVAEVAAHLGCEWHTVNRAVIAYGTALVDDPDRTGPVTTLGLDETAFVRLAKFRHRLWSTQLVGDGQLLDVVAGRDAAPACAWLAGRSESWRAGIEWVTLDLSGSYRSVVDTMLPDATQVADPFHVVRSPASGSTRSAAGSRTRRWATGSARPTRRTAPVGCWSWPTNASTNARVSVAAGCSPRAIRRGRSRTRGPRRKRSVRSTGSASGPSSAGVRRSLRGTPHAPDGPVEAVNNLAKRIKRVASGSRTGPTGASEICSTPAVPTGPSSPPSPRPPRELPKAKGTTRCWPAGATGSARKPSAPTGPGVNVSRSARARNAGPSTGRAGPGTAPILASPAA